MKLHYEPTVRLVTYPVVATADLNRFLAEETAGKWKLMLGESYCDQIPEFAGRLCYMSFDNPRPGGNVKYLERIKGEGHGSVMEHVNFGVLFTGVSRSLTHELVRHRAGTGYSQLSQRYVDESQAEYVVPWELRKAVAAGTDQGVAWLKTVRDAHDAYVQAVDRLMTEKIVASRAERNMNELSRDELTKIRKAARGAARSLLPNATETKILVTANVRAWRHMIEKRCDPAADAEIRLAFHKTFKLLKGYAPNLFADYTEVPLDDETTALTTPTPKV